MSIYTEVRVMSEMKIHPNSQTAFGRQNKCAVPAVVNDVKAKCLVRNSTGIFLSLEYTFLSIVVTTEGGFKQRS